QHVVRVARLGRRGAQMRRRRLRQEEVLALAVAADDPGMLTRNTAPEVFSQSPIGRFAQHFVTASRTGDLRNLRIGVLAGKLVAVGTQWLQHRMMVKSP